MGRGRGMCSGWGQSICGRDMIGRVSCKGRGN